MSAPRRFIARLTNLLRRRTEDREQDEELAFHLEMEVKKNVASGMPEAEAQRCATITLGGVSQVREETRDERLPGWISGLSLDLKLGARMLWKYPGLAVIGGLGLAVAIAIAATSFSVIEGVTDTELPLDEGDRLVAVVNFDLGQPGRYGDRTHLHDLEVWRETATALEDLAAARTVNSHVVDADGRIDPVRVMEMTAEGFRVARVPPLMGRYLTEEDELPGAPPVVVIGYDEWQGRFGGRPDVLGQTLRLNHSVHEIVGVMPSGFYFPVNERIWTPLRLNPLDFPRGEAPAVRVFGRLAPGASLEAAQAQLSAVTRRLASDHPTTHARVTTSVMPFAVSGLDAPILVWLLYLLQLVVTSLLVVIGANVAVLVYARTVSRHAEMVVRTALGASRVRIVGQLFIEAFVLSICAAAAGLAAAHFFLEQIDVAFLQGGNQIPFWWRFELSPETGVYVAGLALLAAVIVGAVPALKATASKTRDNLQRLGAGGTAPQLGRVWTALVIVQIAGAVAVLPIATNLVVRLFRAGLPGPAYASEQVLTASLSMEADASMISPPDGRIQLSADGGVLGLDAARYANLGSELVRRLEAEPGVSHVVAMAMPPRTDPDLTIELAGDAAGAAGGSIEGSRAATPAGWSQVEPDYFEALGLPVLQGRGFETADAAPGATAVIVNENFVDRVLGGANPIGRNIRPAEGGGSERHEAGSVLEGGWYTIVGVVPEVGASGLISEPKIYQATIPRWTVPVGIAIRVRGDDASSFANRVRQIAFALDPTLRLGNLTTVAAQVGGSRSSDRLIVVAFAAVAISTLLLSLGGLYVIVAFTVARRRREIGIRFALGARPHRLLGSMLGRVAAQLALGIAAGLVVATVLDRMMGGEFLTGRNGLLLTGVAGAMMLAGMLAGWGPAREGLRVQPSEALRAE